MRRLDYPTTDPRRGLLRPRGDAPPWCGGRGLPWGLLRPRGDAPPVHQRRHVAKMAPPPTRRCATVLLESSSPIAGSSAHAEMRPGGSSTSTTRSGLLRPRGDAPLLAVTFESRERAPPPTRRCAPRDLQRVCSGAGSSAHAEMRPRSRIGGSGEGGLLRPRGDAPPSAQRTARRATAPPPTRRCAHDGVGVSATIPGSPPPTRRCALAGHAQLEPGHGSSAHAEMRPRQVRLR